MNTRLENNLNNIELLDTNTQSIILMSWLSSINMRVINSLLNSLPEVKEEPTIDEANDIIGVTNKIAEELLQETGDGQSSLGPLLNLHDHFNNRLFSLTGRVSSYEDTYKFFSGNDRPITRVPHDRAYDEYLRECAYKKVMPSESREDYVKSAMKEEGIRKAKFEYHGALVIDIIKRLKTPYSLEGITEDYAEMLEEKMIDKMLERRDIEEHRRIGAVGRYKIRQQAKILQIDNVLEMYGMKPEPAELSNADKALFAKLLGLETPEEEVEEEKKPKITKKPRSRATKKAE